MRRRALRAIADQEPGAAIAVAQALAKAPTAENWPYLVRGVDKATPPTLINLIDVAEEIADQAEGRGPGAVSRGATGQRRLNEKDRWKVVELLRHWSNDKQFGADKGEWKPELTAWSRWYGQAFPKEPAARRIDRDKPAESKYKFDDLLAFLDKDPAGNKGDAAGPGGLREGPVHQVPQVRQGRRRHRAGPHHGVQALQTLRHPGVDHLPVEGHQRSVSLDRRS